MIDPTNEQISLYAKQLRLPTFTEYDDVYCTLSSVLIYLCASVKPNVRQIVCFNNSIKSDDNTHNIGLTKTLNNLVARNYKHQVRYYYDDIYSHLNSFTLYPFMITLGNMAVIIVSDYAHGLFINDINLITGDNRRFDSIYNESDTSHHIYNQQHLDHQSF